MSHFNDEAPPPPRPGRRRRRDPGGIRRRDGRYELRVHLGTFASQAAAIQARDAAMMTLDAKGLLPHKD